MILKALNYRPKVRIRREQPSQISDSAPSPRDFRSRRLYCHPTGYVPTGINPGKQEKLERKAGCLTSVLTPQVPPASSILSSILCYLISVQLSNFAERSQVNGHTRHKMRKSWVENENLSCFLEFMFSLVQVSVLSSDRNFVEGERETNMLQGQLGCIELATGSLSFWTKRLDAAKTKGLVRLQHD